MTWAWHVVTFLGGLCIGFWLARPWGSDQECPALHEVKKRGLQKCNLHRGHLGPHRVKLEDEEDTIYWENLLDNGDT